MEYGDARYIFVCISKLLVLIVIFILSNYRQFKDTDYSRENVWMMMLVFFISFVSLYCLFEVKRDEIGRTSTEHINQVICILAIGIFVINIMFYWIISELNYRLNKEKEYELIECQNKMLSRAILDQEKNHNEWRKMRHDFNNHMSCIDMLLQMENIPKARDYIQKMTHNEKSHELSIQTGNEIVDAVINQKSLRARNDNVDFKVTGEMSSELHMEDMDLCALLSNSIDNAIEAARQVGNEKKRVVQVGFKQTDTEILLNISNSVKENIDVTKKLKTTKKDTKKHGIGMMSMQTTVNKYKGKMTCKCHDYEFNLSIAIPLKNC